MSESHCRRQTAPAPHLQLTWTELTSYPRWLHKPKRDRETRFTFTGTTIGMDMPTEGVLGKWDQSDFFILWFFRWLLVTIACLSSTHMCTMRQNLGGSKEKNLFYDTWYALQILSLASFYTSNWVLRWIVENGGLRSKVLQLLQVCQIFFSARILFFHLNFLLGGDWHCGGDRALHFPPICALDFLRLLQRWRPWQGQSSC